MALIYHHLGVRSISSRCECLATASNRISSSSSNSDTGTSFLDQLLWYVFAAEKLVDSCAGVLVAARDRCCDSTTECFPVENQRVIYIYMYIYLYLCACVSRRGWWSWPAVSPAGADVATETTVRAPVAVAVAPVCRHLKMSPGC